MPLGDDSQQDSSEGGQWACYHLLKNNILHGDVMVINGDSKWFNGD